MRTVLYSHPFSSYCQKVLIALYENGLDFDTRTLGEDDGAYEELVAA
ncbi:glutathione S-transferase [Neorhizobium huautlense]|uniref:Glutathione S-transferase n=1 Tax=Neorhizobium huautlense TaxID=67774 RepID=A0ABT9PNH7_9HYPH|nr:glutathione S-transferase [Neorhizobium huautlense]